MRDEKNGCPLALKLFEPSKALPLKFFITDCQRLVHDQNIRVYHGLDGEGQAHDHAAGIHLYRLLDEFTNVSKPVNIVKPAVDLFLRQAQDGSVQIDIFTAGKLRIEAGAQFQKRGDTTLRRHCPLGGTQCAANDLQEGRFP